GEDAPSLGDQPDAPLGNIIGRKALDLFSFIDDFTLGGWGKADDGPDDGRFPHAVAAQKDGYLSFFHVQGYPMQHMAFTVVGMNVIHLQQPLHLPSRNRLHTPPDFAEWPPVNLPPISPRC